jgi:FkbM family methyltransferase
MLTTVLRAARSLHPLHHLRKVPAFRRLTQTIQIDVPVRVGSSGHVLYVDLFRNMTFALGGAEIVEEREQENLTHLIALLRPNSFFDVGANVGTYISAVLKSAPHARVVAFEPDIRNIGLLHKSCSKNEWRGVTIHPFAASSEVGEITFFVDDVTGATGSITEGEDGTFGQRHYKTELRPMTISATTLDAASQEFGAPELIKIDVEGAEASVFAGAATLLRNSHPAIIFECSQNRAEVAALLLSLDYVLFDFEDLRPVSVPVHNTLALHRTTHAQAISGLTG